MGLKQLTFSKSLFFIALPAFMLGLLSCARKQQREIEIPEIEFDKTTFSFDREQMSGYDIFKAYRLVPGDVLDVLYHVNTWSTDQREFRLSIDHEISVKFVGNPELNESQLVRPDGNISLPYLGSVSVVGKTVDELAAILKKEYSKVLKNPELYIVIPEFRAAIKEFKQDLHTAPRGLSRLTQVRPDGYATFAMIGDIMVNGKTIPEISTVLNDKYEDILYGLSVDLFLEHHQGSNIYVLGEVLRPGIVTISKYTSVIEVLSYAGGFTPQARVTDVVVVRKSGEKMVATVVDVDRLLQMPLKKKEEAYKKAREKDESPENIEPKAGEIAMYFYLQPDDIVYVPRRKLSKMADISKDIREILMFRGWGVSFSYSLENTAVDPDPNDDKRATNR